MKQEKLVPEIRFKAFTDNFEFFRLSKKAKINEGDKKIPSSFIYIDLESVNNGILEFENRITKEDSPSRAQRVLTFGDILFQTVRPYQQNNLHFKKEGDYVASTGYAQIKAHDNDDYLFQYLHTRSFLKKVLLRCTGTSYPAINSKDLAKIPINLPSLPEQQKIADFLTSVDHKIQALTRKVALLKDYKKGVMQKVFKQEIRFRPDDGREFPDWEEKKFSDVFDRVKTKNKENNQTILTISSIAGLVSQRDYFNKIVAAKDVTNYYLINRNDFAYNKSYSKGYPMGSIQRLKDYDKGVLSTLYICFRAMSNYNFKYFDVYFDAQIMNKSLSMIAQEGVRNHGLLNMSVIDFFNIKIQVPSLPEQTKIANFLTSIDDKISAVEEKLDKMKEWKKGLLQKMFV